MSENIIKVGVVGLGRGTAIARCLKGVKNAKLIACCDHNPKILKKGYDELADVLQDKDIMQFSSYDEMLKTDAPPTCPHGRPVLKAFRKSEIERMFKRI